ncbi:MAG: inositol monophosphatase family protein, partial [Actinomycetota bacterium]
EFLNSWDVAAGVLLVREAGGVVTAFDGAPLDVEHPAGVVATGPGLHASLAALLHR